MQLRVGSPRAVQATMTTLETIQLDQLQAVSGGFTKAQQTKIEANAVKYAQHELHASPVFLGDVNNAVGGPTFSKKGVLVSTGDEANVQFFTGRVTIDRSGKPTGLKTL
jgi:hypothetical protein